MTRTFCATCTLLLALTGCGNVGGPPAGGVELAPRLTVGNAMPLPHGTLLHQRSPAVAYGDGVYLLVWQEGFSGLGGSSRILGLFLDARGQPASPKPIEISPACMSQEGPAVAFCAGRFLVVWAGTFGPAGYDVFGVLVSPDPQVTSQKARLLAGGPGAQCAPAVASNGKDQFLVVWQDYGRSTPQTAPDAEATADAGHFAIRGARVDAKAGQLLDKTPLAIMARGERPSVVWTGSNYAICQKWYAALVGPDGKVQMPTTQLWNSKVVGWSSMAAAWSKAFVFFDTEPFPDPWGWGGNGSTTGVSLSAGGQSPERAAASTFKDLQAAEADGRVRNCLDAARWRNHPGWPMGMRGGLKGTHDDTWPSGRPAAAFNGRSLLVVWPRAHLVDNRRLANRDLYLTRVLSPDWAVADARPVRLVAGPTEEANPVLCAGPAGQALMAYERVEPAGVGVEYRLLAEAEDRDPPRVRHIVPQSDTDWIVAFDEPVDPASVKTDGFAIDGLAVKSAAVNPDPRGLAREVVIATEPPVRGNSYTLRVTGVKDRSPAANPTTGQPVEFVAKPGVFQRGQFIERWAVLGPFDRNVKTHPFDPTAARPSPGDGGPAGTGLKWTAVNRPVLDFDQMFNEKNDAMAYANVYVFSDRARQAVLRLDTNDHNRVWLNGKPVHDGISKAAGSRGFHDYTDEVPISLAKGWNRLLVQVDNLLTTWAMVAQITDGEGVPLGDLTWQLERPAE